MAKFLVQLDFETHKAVQSIGERIEVAQDRDPRGAIKRLVSTLLDQGFEQGMIVDGDNSPAKITITPV